MTEAEYMYKSEFECKKDTPLLTLTGELLGVFSENFGPNWPRYNHDNGTTRNLYNSAYSSPTMASIGCVFWVIYHNCDVTWPLWRLKSSASRLFVQAEMKGNI